ncbi:uncharacterized protein LOC129181160 [Dunckerocampus dactyliophorus]|uniref:uncharacterized protein LOC129181160 n=1 Tax=Dunckerocampus dactyliophorus TaxID=161453 RepID=UPI00240629AA|nr:uncharacterized protein LOC129181160 [Dunckerocampus dactyliophorus]
MPQGFKHSPHVFNQVLREDLEGLQLNSTLLQYVDDLLICATTLEDCHRDSIKLLQKLAEGGHKTSRAKLQYCQPQVEYLGRVISHATISVAPSQLEGVSKVPLPLTVGQMMTFLGMTGFSSNWIVDYAVKTAPLREIIKQGETQTLRSPLKWTNESRIAFETIKQEMQTAPALATPDYGKPFFLYVSNRHNMYASAVLMQETCSGRRKQPLAYYSTKLDNVVQGWPPCCQGLAAVHYAYEKASTIIMGHPVTIYTHHKISELIHQNKFVITQARCLQYLPLLTYPDVTIKRCATVNPADTMPFSFEGEPYECVPEAMKYTKLRPDLESTPLLNAEVTYFVDGSCYRDHFGSHAGFAVIKQEGSDFVTIKAESCVQPCSAQLAELKALTEACRTAKGKTANVYTDSAYAHEEKSRAPESTEVSDGLVVPGDQVYIKVYRRKWHEPRREGPYKVVRATPTAVQVEGSTTWYHLNHCTKMTALAVTKEAEAQLAQLVVEQPDLFPNPDDREDDDTDSEDSMSCELRRAIHEDHASRDESFLRAIIEEGARSCGRTSIQEAGYEEGTFLIYFELPKPSAHFHLDRIINQELPSTPSPGLLVFSALREE